MVETGEIKPYLLDLVMRDNDFVIYHGDSPITTPQGNELASPASRILKQLVLELSMKPRLNLRSINTYSLYSFQIDFLGKGKDPLLENFELITAKDPFIRLKDGNNKQSQVFDHSRVQVLFEQHPSLLPVIFWGVSGMVESFNKFLSQPATVSSRQPVIAGDKKVVDILKSIYSKFEIYEKTVVNVLSFIHRSGIALPVLLVCRYINSSEYVNGFMATQLQSGKESVPDADTDKMLKTNFDFLNEYDKRTDPIEFFNDRLNEARNAVEYLISFKEARKEGVAGLIELGESNDLEFKSTLRWDIKAGKTSQLVERGVLKSISAFMNSGGGTLLIGVRDDGSIEGIETDRLPNEDKFLLHFWTLVRTVFGRDISPYIKTKLERIENKTICVVKCFRSQRPVFLKQPGFEEEFFIRVGPSSTALAVSEALKYISDHFSER